MNTFDEKERNDIQNLNSLKLCLEGWIKEIKGKINGIYLLIFLDEVYYSFIS